MLVANFSVMEMTKKLEAIVIQFYITNIGGKLENSGGTLVIAIAVVKNSAVFLRKTYRYITAILHARKKPKSQARSLYLKLPYKSVNNGLNRIAFCHDLPQISFLIIPGLSFS